MMRRSHSPFLYGLFAAASAALLATLAGAAPASAGNLSCSEPPSVRSETSVGTFKVDVANRRATPLTVEWTEASGAKNALTWAPGESKIVELGRPYTLTSRDARRRCLSRFVPEARLETWEITSPLKSDYQRRNAGAFSVYVAPEFNRDHALLERCLQVLESNAKQLGEVLPPAALEALSSVPIWLEYDGERSFLGVYFSSRETLLRHGYTDAKAKSIQFSSWIAVMAGSKRNVLMHELAHAYRDLVLPRSYDGISSAYSSARWSGRYDAVRHSSGSVMKANAMTDDKEFFAELSEAYFTQSDFFPFTREDLKEFDPASYRAISAAWERSPYPGTGLCAISGGCRFRDSPSGLLRAPHRRQYE